MTSTTGVRCDLIAMALLAETLALGAGSAGLSLSAGCSGTVEPLFNDRSKKGPSGQYEMTNTNVELRDGQSFAIAGLIDKRLTDGSSRRVI